MWWPWSSTSRREPCTLSHVRCLKATWMQSSRSRICTPPGMPSSCSAFESVGNCIAQPTPGCVSRPYSSPLTKLAMRTARMPGVTASAPDAQPRHPEPPREQHDRDRDAGEAAVERQPALPDLHEVPGHDQLVRRVVEQRVAEPAAEHHAEHAVEDQVRRLLHADREQAAPR